MVTKLIGRIFLSATCLLVFAAASSAQTTFYFPQIADGTFGGGFFTTTLLVSNNTSTAANVTVTFVQSNGTPFNLAFVDSNNSPVPLAGNVLSITALGPGQSRKLVSTAAAGLTVGYASVTSNVPVTASAVFSQFSGGPGFGTRLSEAAVVPSTPSTNQAIFVDESGNFRTGFAYANPSSTNTATVTFNLIDTAGVPTLTTGRTLPPGNHTSVFIDQLFATNGVTNPLAVGHVGRMNVTSDAPVALMALRFEGNLFTTIPPFLLAGVMGTVEQWLNDDALPGPLATFARLVVGIHSGLG